MRLRGVSKNKIAQALAAWNPDEAYDPMRPNDYNEFKLWQRRDREARRKRILAERRRGDDRKRYRRSSSYSDSYHSASEDERPRKAGESAPPYDKVTALHRISFRSL